MMLHENGSFRTFSEVANRTLGLEEDPNELIPLNVVLGRMEHLFRQDLSRFDEFMKEIEENDRYFSDLNDALEEFCGQLVRRLGVPESKACDLRYVPVEEVVVRAGARFDAHLQFIARAVAGYQFNKGRGNYLFDFCIAHSLAQSTRYNRLSIGMRSKVISYAGSLESVFSIWESNGLGQVWTLPGTALPRNAYAAAWYRLMDGLCGALQFEPTYEIFCRDLNPLEKFPIQFLYNVIMSDQKTVLQEIMQDNRGQLPNYHVTRAGGTEHAPNFQCSLTALNRTFEGFGESKSRAEKAAASKAVEYLDTHDGNKLQLYIAKKIAGGVLPRAKTPIRNSDVDPKFVVLRRTAGLSCANEAIIQCLTVKADRSKFTPTNDEWAFCGSALALVIASERSTDGSGSSMAVGRHVVEAIQGARRELFPRSKLQLSPAAFFDVVQALAYAEFLESGYPAANGVFDRCILAFRKSNQAVSYDQFQPEIPYTMLLQEKAQEVGPELPEFSYVLTNPTQPHAPLFRCVAVCGSQRSEGLGVSKKAARQRAAYELLRNMI
jgi:dsRNA-specific ribonuclease